MSVSDSGPAIGITLGGKYRITNEIGRGGMATIYAAENVAIGKPVAVKVLAEELASSKTVNERFLREARAAAQLHSPYICEVYDVGTYQERPFIVMELLDGESLYDRLARERRLSTEDTFQIAQQTARGLAKAHAKQIVHRDLKPENIFLTTGEDGQPLAKVVDFGLAKFYEPHQDSANARLTKEGALFGTPAYMSPEQASGRGNVDHRSDLWALGCIVFEMLTGRTVWNVNQGVPMILAQIATSVPPQPRKLRPDLPINFDAWFKKALSRDVSKRFQSTQDFIAELADALGYVDPNSGAGYPIPTPMPANVPNPFNAPAGQGPRSSPLPPPPGASHPGSLPGGPSAMDALNTPARSDSERPAANNRALIWGLLISLLLIGAGVLWFTGALGFKDGLARLVGHGRPPVETADYAAPIAKAQMQLSEGKGPEALRTLRESFEASRGKAARSLFYHVSDSLEEQARGGCVLTGIGHPRPFDRKTESSQLSVVRNNTGLLAAWADSDENAKRVQAYSVVLDQYLRRVSVPLSITPQAVHARKPTLFRVGDKVGLLYWDFAGKEPGIYTRLLTQDGKISGARHRIGNAHEKHPYYPSIAPDEEGNFWVTWIEPTRDKIHDLFVQKLGPNLEPLSKAKAVTAYPTPSSAKTQAARPVIAIAGGWVHIAYALRRANTQQILLLRAPPRAFESQPSVVPASVTETPSPSNEEYDRFIGQVLPISKGEGKHDYPQIACDHEGCLVAWDEIATAARVARVDLNGKVLWRQQMVVGGGRPGISMRPESKALASWFKDKHISAGTLTNGKPTRPAVVGRVSAALQQPPPTVIPAENAGEWYIGWRGYESAVQEPFVARISCP